MIVTKRIFCATACGMMMILQSACANVSPASFCALYVPVYTSGADSEETRRQADVNNAVWLALCTQEHLAD